MEAKFTSLLETARQVASTRQASVPAVIKELLHYEIIQALVDSGSAASLVFQGGTALRLCYGGLRYSEDLDFAGGLEFSPSVMKPFMNRLVENVGTTYGLTVDVDEHLPNEEDNVPVGRWKSKIVLPQYDRSLKQSYVIHVEVAKVPAYTSETRSIQPISNSTSYSHRSLILKTESREEILADKIVALVGRSYLKQRDLWDIHMLTQQYIKLDTELVQRKVADYHLDPNGFHATLQARAEQITQPHTATAFQKEMSRFIDASLQKAIQNKEYVRQILTTVADVASQAAKHMGSSD